MSEVEPKPPKGRWVRLRVAVIAAVLTAVGVGAGGYYVGLQAGEQKATGPSADFIYRQQAAAATRLKETTKALVAIEQSSAQLLVGKSGDEVDAEAFYRLRTQYAQMYDAVLAEGGRIRALFSSRVRTAARAISHSGNVAMTTLYPEQETLADLSAAQIHAILVNSHTARKAQWAAVRKFDMLATAEMIDGD